MAAAAACGCVKAQPGAGQRCPCCGGCDGERHLQGSGGTTTTARESKERASVRSGYGYERMKEGKAELHRTQSLDKKRAKERDEEDEGDKVSADGNVCSLHVPMWVQLE